MRKKDRTAEEKAIDRLTRSGIMHLGAQSSQEATATPNPFPYVIHWQTSIGRKGQRCRVIGTMSPRQRIVLVEFPDGFQSQINRNAMRRSDGT